MHFGGLSEELNHNLTMLPVPVVRPFRLHLEIPPVGFSLKIGPFPIFMESPVKASSC